jgi:two-component system, sensor histidine kinase and response regulator
MVFQQWEALDSHIKLTQKISIEGEGNANSKFIKIFIHKNNIYIMYKILVVEDTQYVREEIRDILTIENFEVFEASNGFEGIEAVSKEIPDLIISDISMPQLNGYEFLTELRSNAKTENIPFIFLSAKSDLSDIRRGMNLGADDYLIKPLSPDELINVVNKKLELKFKLEKKLKDLKSQLIDYMPHELITPLNGIFGLSDFLRENAEMSGNELYTIANGIYNSGEKLNHLINNYLLYSRLLAENITPQKRRKADNVFILSTHKIIAEILNKIDENRKNDLILLIEPVKINFSKNEFSEIFEELLFNALKFSTEGNILLIYSNIKNDKYILRIENYGVGISSEQIEHIGAFVQFNRKVNEQQGLGLGLEIVRLITELNGGKMVIDSKLDEYFLVTVELPV